MTKKPGRLTSEQRQRANRYLRYMKDSHNPPFSVEGLRAAARISRSALEAIFRGRGSRGHIRSLLRFFHGTQRPIEELERKLYDGDVHIQNRSTLVSLGDYNEVSVKHLIGNYITLRTASGSNMEIYSTFLNIEWDIAGDAAIFHEYRSLADLHSRENHTQRGALHHSKYLNTYHLLSSAEGGVRLISFSSLRTDHEGYRPHIPATLITQIPHHGGHHPKVNSLCLGRITQDDTLPEEGGIIAKDHAFLTEAKGLVRLTNAELAKLENAAM